MSGRCSESCTHYIEPMWYPGSERPVYLTLPAQRSSLLAMFNILVQKQPLHLWYMRIQHLRIQATSRHSGTWCAATLCTLFMSYLGPRFDKEHYGSGTTR